jgi:segregation and condensation protein A
MNDASFRISVGGFEGPLDLLLELIERRKMRINDISLVSVTDDFVSYIKTLGELPLGQASNFIYMASMLLLLKSKSLLPMLELSPEEEEGIEDLERRLKLYKYFRERGQEVLKIFGKHPMFTKSYTRNIEPVFAPQSNLSPIEIKSAIHTILKNLPKKTFVRKEVSVRKVVSLEEMIERLAKRIQKDIQLSFREFSGTGKQEKIHIIIGFLAMLELVKQEIISVKQSEHFADIEIESKKINLPQYGGA